MTIVYNDGEFKSFLQTLFKTTGFDFREYALSSLKRRVTLKMKEENLTSLALYQRKVLNEPESMKQLLRFLSVTVTSMFRNPGFFLYFKQKIIPWLDTYPSVRIWIAGCSTGEEVYSTNILLKEGGILDKCTIYATDINTQVLLKAKNGVFPLSVINKYSENYFEAGGEDSLIKYCTEQHNDSIKFDPELVKNVVWSKHNLASDYSFNEFNVIFCRNVLIYFNNKLQNRVHDLLHQSLTRFGVLGLGDKETITFSSQQSNYEILDSKNKIYRKVK